MHRLFAATGRMMHCNNGVKSCKRRGISMENPLVKKDLVDAIVELREEVERCLKANKYYVAMNKLDELLAAIRPLEIIEATVNPPASPKPEAEAAAPEPQAAAEKVWSGLVQESVVEGDALRAS
jgi:hypothetical protein